MKKRKYSGFSKCPDCNKESQLRMCDECGLTLWVIDCGHEPQPVEIAPGRADGSDLEHTYCYKCACGGI
jgi:Zn ribbon nucleic-acid-binding protein